MTVTTLLTAIGRAVFVCLTLCACLSLSLSSLSPFLSMALSLRWVCHCVPGADSPGGALCPEEDVCQQ